MGKSVCALWKVCLVTKIISVLHRQRLGQLWQCSGSRSQDSEVCASWYWRKNVNIFCSRKMRCLDLFWPSRLRADCLKDLAGLHEVLDVLPQDCVLRFEPQVLLLNLINQSEMSIVTLHQSQLTLSTRCVRSSSVFCSSNTWAISRAFSSCSSWKYLNVWKIF